MKKNNELQWMVDEIDRKLPKYIESHEKAKHECEKAKKYLDEIIIASKCDHPKDQLCDDPGYSFGTIKCKKCGWSWWY